MEWISEIEFNILYFLQTLHRPWLDSFMVAVTSLGDHGLAGILLGMVLFCIKRTRKMGAAILLSIMLGFLAGNIVLKNLFARQRPCWMDTTIPLLVKNPWDYSFPSGHTMVSFEVAVSVFLMNKPWGKIALAVAALVAFSRLYLFVHFPSDVLAGVALAAGLALAANRLVLWWYDKRQKDKAGHEYD